MSLVQITDYATLKTSVAGIMQRTGDTELEASIPAYIQLCESTLQVKCKLLDFEGSATIVITNGVGALPTDWNGGRALYWDDDDSQELTYLTPAQFDAKQTWGGDAYFYTVTGTSIKVIANESGSIIATYKARFVPLSVSNTTNALLLKYPEAYLYGSAAQACIDTDDDRNLAKFGGLFSDVLDRINKDNEDRKYPGPITVRAD